MNTRQQYEEAYRQERIERPTRRWVNPYHQHPLMSTELSEKYLALYEKRDRALGSDHTLMDFNRLLWASERSLRAAYLHGTGCVINIRFGWHTSKGE